MGQKVQKDFQVLKVQLENQDYKDQSDLRDQLEILDQMEMLDH